MCFIWFLTSVVLFNSSVIFQLKFSLKWSHCEDAWIYLKSSFDFLEFLIMPVIVPVCWCFFSFLSFVFFNCFIPHRKKKSVYTLLIFSLIKNVCCKIDLAEKSKTPLSKSALTSVICVRVSWKCYKMPLAFILWITVLFGGGKNNLLCSMLSFQCYVTVLTRKPFNLFNWVSLS